VVLVSSSERFKSCWQEDGFYFCNEEGTIPEAWAKKLEKKKGSCSLPAITPSAGRYTSNGERFVFWNIWMPQFVPFLRSQIPYVGKIVWLRGGCLRMAL